MSRAPDDQVCQHAPDASRGARGGARACAFENSKRRVSSQRRARVEDDGDEQVVASPKESEEADEDAEEEEEIEEVDVSEKAEEKKEAAKTFKELGVCEELIQATKLMGWAKPSEIQSMAIP